MKKIKKKIMFFLLFLFVISLFGCSEENQEIKEYDYLDDYKCSDCNVILITIDSLRADHLGCYGYERNTSPNIDNFAKKAILFEQAITQWPSTTPSMAAMHTGTYAHTNGVLRTQKRRLNLSNTMIAEVLDEAGYNTAGVVHNPSLHSFYNFDQGMESYIHVADQKDLWSKGVSYTTYELSSNILKNISNDKFFLWIHILDPHSPYEPPYPYNESFIDDDYFAYDEIEFDYSESCDRMFMPCARDHKNLDNSNLHFHIAQYDGEILLTDFYINTFLQDIDFLNLTNNTLIILTSDHGESLGDHNYYLYHGKLPYDACSRVPLIISHPNLPKNVTIHYPVALIDIMPTILDFLDLPPPEIVEGKSLFPLIFENKSHKKYVFSEAGYSRLYMRSVRDERWKLIFAPNPSDRKGSLQSGSFFELYDIISDPNETENLFYRKPIVSIRLTYNLIKFILTQKKFAPVSQPVNPEDEKTLEQLKALGYVN